MLHKDLLLLLLVYRRETLVLGEKENSGITCLQVDNFRGFMDIKGADGVPNMGVRN